MHTKACLEWLADGALFQTKSDVLEWLYHRATAKPTQVATADSRTLIFGVFLCQCSKVCTLGCCQGVDAIHRLDGLCHTCIIARRGHLHDVRCMYLFVIALLFHFRNMETKGAAEDIRYLSYWSVIYCLFEWIYIAECRYPTQRTIVLRYGWVFGICCGYCSKVFYLLYDHFLASLFYLLRQTYGHSLTQFVDLSQRLCFCLRCSIHRTLYSNMGCSAWMSHAVITQINQTIDSSIVLHVLRCGLCTIPVQLFAKGLRGVHAL